MALRVFASHRLLAEYPDGYTCKLFTDGSICVYDPSGIGVLPLGLGEWYYVDDTGMVACAGETAANDQCAICRRQPEPATGSGNAGG